MCILLPIIPTASCQCGWNHRRKWLAHDMLMSVMIMSRPLAWSPPGLVISHPMQQINIHRQGKPKPGGPSEPSAALPSANPPQQVFATALEAASAAASAMVKEKVKQIAASRAAGQLLGKLAVYDSTCVDQIVTGPMSHNHRLSPVWPCRGASAHYQVLPRRRAVGHHAVARRAQDARGSCNGSQRRIRRRDTQLREGRDAEHRLPGW